jgi:tetratricopeptide (TPR) repeat protein
VRGIVLSLALLLPIHAPAVERPELSQVPLPDLSTMGDATRRRLEALQDRVAELTPLASDGELAEAYGTLGTYYLAHHLNDAAEVAFRNASLLSPGDFRWPYYRGFVCQLAGQLEEARVALGRAFEIRPGDIPAHLRLARLLLELGENEEAYRRFHDVLELSPTEAAAHSGIGRAASALGRYDEAVEHFNRALELQPLATRVHYHLALAHRRLGDMEAARNHLEQRGDGEAGFSDPLMNAIEPLKSENVVEVVLEMAMAPEDHDDRSVAQFAAAYLGDVPQAVDQIHEAVETLANAATGLVPLSEQADHNRLVRARLHLAVAGLHLEQNDLGGARPEIEAALELVPEMAEANLMQGFVLEQTGNLMAAVERYAAILEADPDNTYALRSRANASFDLRRDREAIGDLERLCELGLERDGARIRLAVAYLRLGELATARDHYQRALELNLDPSDAAQVHHHLGVIEDRTGSAERALEEYRIALALAPGLVAPRLDLASVLSRLGRYQESAQTYLEVVEMDPGNVQARRGEAEALEALGRSREALQRLEKGWQAIPESVELLHAMARLLASADDPEVRDGERALELARRTLRAAPTPSRIETLAMACAEAGVFNDAVRLQREVIRTMTWHGRSDVLPRLEANLARYKAGLTCCAPWPAP